MSEVKRQGEVLRLARTVLEEVQWNGEYLNRRTNELFETCPSCYEQRTVGHKPTCAITGVIELIDKIVESGE